jgi:hypothetical protein
MGGCGMVTGAVPGAVITAASVAATSQIALTQAMTIPKAISAPHMIASIHGDVIRTLGPVWHCECEALHIASNLFIEHKTLRYLHAKDKSRSRKGRRLLSSSPIRSRHSDMR